jgi:hypothetical protein
MQKRDIPENGPVLSLSSVCSVGDTICHYVTYQNGTGPVIFLQSALPSLTYGCFDYITAHKEMGYAKQFSEILQKETHTDDDYNPEDYLSIRDAALRDIFDRHNVYAACKGQDGDEWRSMRTFTITLTLCHAILPRTDKDLSDNKIFLLKENLGLDIKSESDAELDKSWQHKTPTELRQLCNEQLKVVCKSYGRPFLNKNKK